jgi:hypothetical protein
MSAKSTPSVDDMYIAAQWLDVYEGAEDAAVCHRVAEWLKEQADKKELREAARAAGVPVGIARKAISKAAVRG